VGPVWLTWVFSTKERKTSTTERKTKLKIPLVYG